MSSCIGAAVAIMNDPALSSIMMNDWLRCGVTSYLPATLGSEARHSRTPRLHLAVAISSCTSIRMGEICVVGTRSCRNRSGAVKLWPPTGITVSSTSYYLQSVSKLGAKCINCLRIKQLPHDSAEPSEIGLHLDSGQAIVVICYLKKRSSTSFP